MNQRDILKKDDIASMVLVILWLRKWGIKDEICWQTDWGMK